MLDFRGLLNVFLLQVNNMKLDTSGLESTAPLFRSSNVIFDGLQMTPSFELPNALDVI